MPTLFSAPFFHLHGHEESDHFLQTHLRQNLVSHPHLSTCGGDHGGRAGIASCADEDAVFLDWIQGGAQPGPILEFVLVETAVIRAPVPIAFWTEIPTHCSHDPPLIVSLSPRSPPAARLSTLGV